MASDSASSALSMPEALSAAFGASSSSCDRSRPRLGPAAVFLTAVLDFLGAAREGSEASSWAARASRSAFLRAASAFLAASASLSEVSRVSMQPCMSSSASLFPFSNGCVVPPRYPGTCLGWCVGAVLVGHGAVACSFVRAILVPRGCG